MNYTACFDIYENCCIYGNDDRTIEADSLEEAQQAAEDLAEEIQSEYEIEHPKYDWWVTVSEVIQEDE